MIKQKTLIKRGKNQSLFWKLTWPFIWINLSPFIPGCFVPSLDEIGPVVLEENILKFLILRIVKKLFRNVFLLFHYYTPLEMGIALQLSKLESPSPRDAFCQFKFNWNWPIGSGGKNFNFINVLSLFRYYLPLEICVALHLNELKYSSHKNVLFQV